MASADLCKALRKKTLNDIAQQSVAMSKALRKSMSKALRKGQPSPVRPPFRSVPEMLSLHKLSAACHGVIFVGSGRL